MEQELKILLTEKEYKTIKAFATVPAQAQTNFYFQTSDLTQMVRIRQKANGQYELTFKRNLSSDDGVFLNVEKNHNVNADFLAASKQEGLSGEFLQEVFGEAFEEKLEFLGSLTTNRTKFDFFGFLIELDENLFDNFVDYELEFESQNHDHLSKLRQKLHELGVVGTLGSAKYQRFLEKNL